MSFASQKIRRSLWNISGVSVRLKFPSPAMPALKNGVCAMAFAVLNEPYECPPIPSFWRSMISRRSSSSITAERLLRRSVS